MRVPSRGSAASLAPWFEARRRMHCANSALHHATRYTPARRAYWCSPDAGTRHTSTSVNIIEPFRSLAPPKSVYGTSFGNSFLHCWEMIGYSHFLAWNALNSPSSQSTKQNTDQIQPSSSPKIPRCITERITVRILMATETTKAVHPKKMLSMAQCRAKESFFSIK